MYDEKSIGVPDGGAAGGPDGLRQKEELPPVEEPPPVEAPEPLPAPEPEPEPEPYVPAGTNPLTGLPIEPEEMAKRPVAVMLNNIKRPSRR